MKEKLSYSFSIKKKEIDDGITYYKFLKAQLYIKKERLLTIS